jgi:hypothetical protein
MCNPSGISEEIPSASAREQLRDLKGHAEVSNNMQTWIVLEVESDFMGSRGRGEMAADCFLNRGVKFWQCLGLRPNAAAIWTVP